MVGISATAVWTVVVKRVGALRIEEGGKKTFANVSGALSSSPFGFIGVFLILLDIITSFMKVTHGLLYAISRLLLSCSEFVRS